MTEKEQLLTSDVREIADAMRTAWAAHEAWRACREQVRRLLAEAGAKHTADRLGPALGLAPILLESVITNPDIGNLQYLVRAIERRRTMEVEG